MMIESPFAGQLLLTLESDRVLSSRVVEIAGTRTELDLPVNDQIRGGAFVCATIVRPIDPKDAHWLPHRAMGVVRLSTEHSAHQLPVTFAAPTRAEPGQHIDLEVRSALPIPHKP